MAGRLELTLPRLRMINSRQVLLNESNPNIFPNDVSKLVYKTLYTRIAKFLTDRDKFLTPTEKLLTGTVII